MNSNRWEVALSKKLVEFCGTESALDENDDLVELEAVEQVVELTILLRLIELDAVLLKTMKGELGLIVNVNLERVPHELLADRSYLL